MSADRATRTRGHVAVGGAVGALTRVGLVAGALVLGDAGEVLAVLVVNLLGAFALGWLVGRAQHDQRWRQLVPLLGTGLLGALTTFATLADQLARQALAGEVLAALLLGAGSIVGGVAAAVVGLRRGRRGAVDVAQPATPGDDGPDAGLVRPETPDDEGPGEPEVGA